MAGGVNNARAFDQLIQRLRSVATALPDRRTGDNIQCAMADIALAAFSVFFTQCPSFLSYQLGMEQARGRNNARSLFQVGHISGDNHIRQTLDPVAPQHLFSLFGKGARGFRWVWRGWPPGRRWPAQPCCCGGAWWQRRVCFGFPPPSGQPCLTDSGLRAGGTSGDFATGTTFWIHSRWKTRK